MSGQNKCALVTGASSGFGVEFCHLLAGEGYDLVIVARREDKLQALATQIREQSGKNVTVLAMDLTKEAAAESLYQSVQVQGMKVDLLVNNAGVGRFGEFHEMDQQENEDMIKLNILALTSLTRLFGKDMLAAGQGHILNVASIAAFQPSGPRFAVYYASKTYVLSLTRSLREEFKGTGVVLTTLCPGPVKTEFGDDDAVQNTRLYKMLASGSAKQVAAAGYQGLMKNKATVVPGMMNKLLAFGGELPPRIFARITNQYLLGKSKD